MNSEFSESSITTTNGSIGLDGRDGKVHRVAQKAHHAVDKLEETIGSSSEKVMGWQHEYGELARDQVKAHPLMAVGAAFAVGVVFSKLFMR